MNKFIFSTVLLCASISIHSLNAMEQKHLAEKPDPNGINWLEKLPKQLIANNILSKLDTLSQTHMGNTCKRNKAALQLKNQNDLKLQNNLNNALNLFRTGEFGKCLNATHVVTAILSNFSAIEEVEDLISTLFSDDKELVQFNGFLLLRYKLFPLNKGMKKAAACAIRLMETENDNSHYFALRLYLELFKKNYFCSPEAFNAAKKGALSTIKRVQKISLDILGTLAQKGPHLSKIIEIIEPLMSSEDYEICYTANRLVEKFKK